MQILVLFYFLNCLLLENRKILLKETIQKADRRHKLQSSIIHWYINVLISIQIMVYIFNRMYYITNKYQNQGKICPALLTGWITEQKLIVIPQCGMLHQLAFSIFWKPSFGNPINPGFNPLNKQLQEKNKEIEQGEEKREI